MRKRYTHLLKEESNQNLILICNHIHYNTHVHGMVCLTNTKLTSKYNCQ